MAEVAAAAFSALTSTLTSAGSAMSSALGFGGSAAAAAGAPLNLTAGAAGAASSAGLFGGASSWLTLLQGGATGLSMLSTLQGAGEKSDSLKSAALDAENQIGLERIAGQQRQSSLKKQTANQIAERDQAYAASGVDLSFGTPQIAKEQDIADSERALSIDQNNTDQQVQRLQERAAEFRRSAASARRAGTMKAVLTGLDGVLGVKRRGNTGI